MDKFYLNYGIPIIIDDRLQDDYKPIQFRFPKSKKKRIRKKFSKNNNNYKMTIIPRIYKLDNKIMVSKETYRLVKNILV